MLISKLKNKTKTQQRSFFSLPPRHRFHPFPFFKLSQAQTIDCLTYQRDESNFFFASDVSHCTSVLHIFIDPKPARILRALLNKDPLNLSQLMERDDVCCVIEAPRTFLPSLKKKRPCPPFIRLWLMQAERDSPRQTLYVKESRKALHSSLRLPLDVHEHHGATVDVELST